MSSVTLAVARLAILALGSAGLGCSERTAHFRIRPPAPTNDIPSSPGVFPAYLGIAIPIVFLAVVLAGCAVKSRRAAETARNISAETESLTGITVSDNPMRAAVLAVGRASQRDSASCGSKAPPQPVSAAASRTPPAPGRASSAALRCTATTAGLTASASDQSLSALIQHDHLPQLAPRDHAATSNASPTLRAIPEASPVFEPMDDVEQPALPAPAAPADASSSIRGLVAELRAAQQALPVSPTLSPASPPRAPPPLVDPATSSIPTLVADLRAAQLESQRRLVVAAAAAEAGAAHSPPPSPTRVVGPPSPTGKAGPPSPRRMMTK